MSALPQIQIYEPALCCNTGVCGPELDQSLVTFTADLAHLDSVGAQIQRHNLASEPGAFVESDTVRDFLHIAGSEGLPFATVDGHTVLTGRYPMRPELLRWAGLAVETPDDTEGKPTPPLGSGLTLTPVGSGDEASACAPAEGCC